MKQAALLVAAIVTLVAPTQAPGKRLCFVVDISGSMHGWEIDKAIEAFQTYAGQPIDEGELKVIAFDATANKWPHGWKPLPDADAINAAQEWLNGEFQASNSYYTACLPAMKLALKDDVKELTVVVVSDGRFHKDENVKVIKQTIANLQAGRRHRAQIGVIGIHRPGADKPELRALVDGAGYYAFPRDPVEEEEEE